MTDPMVERVARASFAWWKEQNSRAANFEDMNSDELEFALGHARAAIVAMREPTEGMVRAGADCDGATVEDTATCETHYQAMIDAALKP